MRFPYSPIPRLAGDRCVVGSKYRHGVKYDSVISGVTRYLTPKCLHVTLEGAFSLFGF